MFGGWSRSCPSEKPGFEAKAFWWVRTSAVAGGLDERLSAAFQGGLRDRWPFKRIALSRPRYLLGCLARRELRGRAARDRHHPGWSIQLPAKRF